MIISTSKADYDLAINVVQLEITGRCNMNCMHCRGLDSKKCEERDMPFSIIKKAIDYAISNAEDNLLEIVLSGGEPLLHPELERILQYCEMKHVKTEITTNGSLLDSHFIEMFRKYKVNNISVSLDSHLAEKHDSFRNYPGAYQKVIDSIKLLKINGINCRIRSTFSKLNYDDMESLVIQAIDMNVGSLAIGAVIPVGNAVNISDQLFEDALEFRIFIDRFFELKEIYKNDIEIITNECLHGLRYLDFNKKENKNDIELNGCTAGITSFNVLLNGDVTPCSMFHKKILNLHDCDDFVCGYAKSPIIKKLLDRDYSGKCGSCDKKYVCGGCRVRAEYYTGDAFGEDRMCWAHEDH